MLSPEKAAHPWIVQTKKKGKPTNKKLLSSHEALSAALISVVKNVPLHPQLPAADSSVQGSPPSAYPVWWPWMPRKTTHIGIFVKYQQLITLSVWSQSNRFARGLFKAVYDCPWELFRWTKPSQKNETTCTNTTVELETAFNTTFAIGDPFQKNTIIHSVTTHTWYLSLSSDPELRWFANSPVFPSPDANLHSSKEIQKTIQSCFDIFPSPPTLNCYFQYTQIFPASQA